MEPRPPARFDSSYVTAMSHFYRGEIGRIMSWRTRLDHTTNWAITATSTVITVSFSVRDVPHVIFLYNIVIVGILLWIEARRYRFYDAFRARVRMLEAHFLVPVLLQNDAILEGNWRQQLAEDLIIPSFKISAFEAVGRRMKRNYVFIFIVILAAWVTKVMIHAPRPINSFRTFSEALQMGTHVPGWLTIIAFIATFLMVLGTTIYFSLRGSSEFSDLGPRKPWGL